MDSWVSSITFLVILLLSTQSESYGITTKEAIAGLKEKETEEINEMYKVLLVGLHPPISKMDASLSKLSSCEKLSLDTNSIEKIEHLDGLKHLQVLSLGRNNIKNLTGLEAVGDTLKELWISYNAIEKLDGITALKKLEILYMGHNAVNDWSEFDKLALLPMLNDLLMIGNPLEEKHSADGDWRDKVIQRLPQLKKLDGKPVVKPEEEEEEEV